MRWKDSFALVVAMALSLSATAANAAPQSDDPRVWGYMPGPPQLTGEDLDAAIVTADQHPLGSTDNPVRVERPDGQRAYLRDLRCSDLTQPQFKRRGNVGLGVFGNIVDLYDVDCGDAAPGKVEIYMDMYFIGEGETRAVPGFTIAR